MYSKVWLVIWTLWIASTLVAHEDKAPVVLVTGASQGIGLTTAKLLADNGCTVYGSLRESSDPELFSKAQHLTDGALHSIFIDLTDTLSVENAIEQIIQNEGRIDILINNAGCALFGSLENTTIEEAKKIFEVNFFGVMRVLHATLPYMREQRSGHILNISSRAGFRPSPSVAIYSASKHALEAITETMAYNLAPFNIKVSSIQPGPVRTELLRQMKNGSHLTLEEDPYYPRFVENGSVMEVALAQAQDPMEVAQVVLDAIKATKPHLHYQTHPYVASQAAERFLDPTGDKSLQGLKTGLRVEK